MEKTRLFPVSPKGESRLAGGADSVTVYARGAGDFLYVLRSHDLRTPTVQDNLHKKNIFFFMYMRCIPMPLSKGCYQRQA